MEEKQTHIRRTNEPYMIDDDKLVQISPSGKTKIYIVGQIIEVIITDAYKQEGNHQTFKDTG